MAINQEKKSNRLLGGRRFTSADLNTSQEAFTEVLDLRASEIFTQGHLVPSSDYLLVVVHKVVISLRFVVKTS